MENPNLQVFLTYLPRGAGIWLGARAVAVAVFALANQLNAALEPSPLFILLAVGLGQVDIRLARERALLGNLGVTLPHAAIPFAAAAAMGEGAIALLHVLLA